MKKISILWFRRDLRLKDNTALFHALTHGDPVLPLFIFDKIILDKLPEQADPRVSFIYKELQELTEKLENHGSSLLVKHGKPLEIWNDLIKDYEISSVFVNNDYEPYARERDSVIASLLKKKNIPFNVYKDHVLFEEDEIVKPNGSPYTIFTPYYKRWREKINDKVLKEYPSENLLHALFQTKKLSFPSLKQLGFEVSNLEFPSKNFELALNVYEKWRDFPAKDATSKIGIHLRFGTLSIREAIRTAVQHNANKWLSEIAWRDFYAMILWHFPNTRNGAFKPMYDNIQWRNNEIEFKAWCEGKTGYPLVDAGMRQLNETGYMHNRLRMVTASFLTKHLLIDWRWGESYFAAKLLDYDMASNVGGWQWAAGSGNDAAPYFRIFSPDAQTKRFDPNWDYINKWIPEIGTNSYPQPIIDHAFARERVLKEFKKALS